MRATELRPPRQHDDVATIHGGWPDRVGVLPLTHRSAVRAPHPILRFTPAATAFFAAAVADTAAVFLAAIATDEIVTD